ncbi:hypothetical protein AB0B89_29215 [Sphaerisporangium sp. NPDC049002]|uniref:hypothetical protein n=1 Tax=Sphaerisporangium sp. NPDC049002 TaxID=3155392 RepID=UPI0033D3A757
MCSPPPKVTAGAILANAMLSKAGLIVGGIAASGLALYVAAGTALTAYVWMVLVGWAAVSTILLLRRRADPVRQVVRTQSRPAPRRVHAEILASRPQPALEAAEHHYGQAETRDRSTAW